MAELQRDPVSRGQFLTMGVVGSLVGAALTIPPFVFIISPTIETNFLGESDVPDDWIEVGSVWEIPSGSPKEYRAEFPQLQTYDSGQPGAEEGEQPEGVPPNAGVITDAVLVSWRDGKLPTVLEENGDARTLSASEVEELTQLLNVMSNHCAHLGCPVRWHAENGLIVCPCHGGEYGINGNYLAGPPPHGLFHFVHEIREDGGIYVKHEFRVKNPATDEFSESTPWVV